MTRPLPKTSLVLCAVLLAAGHPSVHAQGPRDNTSPRAVVEALQRASSERDTGAVRALLDKSVLPEAQRSRLAAEVARGVLDLLAESPALTPGAVPESPASARVEVGSLVSEGTLFPLVLEREPDGMGWAISGVTVRAVHEWQQNLPVTWPGKLVPRVLREERVLGMTTWQWVDLASLVGLAFLVALFGVRALRASVRRVLRAVETVWSEARLMRMVGPTRLFMFMALSAIGVQRLHLPAGGMQVLRSVLGSGFVVAVVWFSLRAVRVGVEVLEEKTAQDATDPARVRAVHTQLRVLARVAQAIIWVIGAALVFTQFEVMRQVGTSLLASAGVAGVVLGVAAQRSIGMLLAGLQLSLTQPIRLGDKLILDNEFGEVEEITLTYAVVKLWDGRRMVVPITRFLDQTFQNWTLRSQDLLGVVLLYVDYSAPVDVLREELARAVKTFPEHDGKHCSLAVTNVTDKVMELRALASAVDAPTAFELRCRVREHMMGFLQKLNGGNHLPRNRNETTTFLPPGVPAPPGALPSPVGTPPR